MGGRRRRKTPPGAVQKRGPGKPFSPGFDPRRNLRGPIPELHEIRLAITRDGLAYVDQLFRLAKKGNATAVRVAIEQMLGRPPASLVLTTPEGKPLQLQVGRLSELTDDELSVIQRVAARLGGAPQPGGDRAGAAPASLPAQ